MGTPTHQERSWMFWRDKQLALHAGRLSPCHSLDFNSPTFCEHLSHLPLWALRPVSISSSELSQEHSRSPEDCAYIFLITHHNALRLFASLNVFLTDCDLLKDEALIVFSSQHKAEDLAYLFAYAFFYLHFDSLQKNILRCFIEQRGLSFKGIKDKSINKIGHNKNKRR